LAHSDRSPKSSNVNAGKAGRKTYGLDGKQKLRSSPELLRPELRRLPGELVTKDTDDPDKVHDLDASHIVEALTHEYCQKHEETDQPKVAPEKAPVKDILAGLEQNRLTQDRVDIVRMRVLRAWADTQRQCAADGVENDFDVKHLWFEDDDIRAYCWREGNAPADIDRPKHLKGLDLSLDIINVELPNTITRRLNDAGVESIDIFIRTDDVAPDNQIVTSDGTPWMQ
jgi:hypothetical protein